MANISISPWFCRDNSPSGAPGTGTVGWSAVTQWAALTAVAAGVLRRQTNASAVAVGNERVFVCIVAGTSLASEPTWVLTKGAKTVETAGPTWQECTGQPGVNGDLADTPTWAQQHAVSTTVTIGLIIQDAVADCLFIVGTAGTIGAAEPAWNKTAGATTTDSGVTWISLGAPANFGAWAAPFARMIASVVATWAPSGAQIRVGDDHSETQAAAWTMAPSGTVAQPSYFLSVDHTTTPVNTAALKAGASAATTGANSLTFTTGLTYCEGLTLTAGSAANAASIGLSGANTTVEAVFVDCALVLGNTNAASLVSCAAGTSGQGSLKLKGTSLTFGSVGQSINCNRASFEWKATLSAILGSVPTTLFTGAPANACIITVDGVDLSAAGSGKTLVGAAVTQRVSLNNCTLGASVVIAATPTSQIADASRVDYTNCDSAGTNYLHGSIQYAGTQSVETVIVRTGGASNGVTAISEKIVTTANSLWVAPFQSLPIAIYNTVTGTNRVITLYALYNGPAMPNNDDMWIEAEYFGSASSPQGSFANNTKANILAANAALTADSTSVWTSLVAARQNSHAYSVGDAMYPTGNPNRVFFCTASTGNSAAAEPGGYASAVDGGSVTDGNCTFRAAVRFVLAVTLSSPQPAMAGSIYVTVNAAKVTSTFWVDPLINLS